MKRTLYDVTGNILDVNTVLVPITELQALENSVDDAEDEGVVRDAVSDFLTAVVP